MAGVGGGVPGKGLSNTSEQQQQQFAIYNPDGSVALLANDGDGDDERAPLCAPAQPAPGHQPAHQHTQSSHAPPAQSTPMQPAQPPSSSAMHAAPPSGPPLLVLCPRCHRQLMPPAGAPVFACPCGQRLANSAFQHPPPHPPPHQTVPSGSGKSLDGGGGHGMPTIAQRPAPPERGASMQPPPAAAAAAAPSPPQPSYPPLQPPQAAQSSQQPPPQPTATTPQPYPPTNHMRCPCCGVVIGVPPMTSAVRCGSCSRVIAIPMSMYPGQQPPMLAYHQTPVFTLPGVVYTGGGGQQQIMTTMMPLQQGGIGIQPAPAQQQPGGGQQQQQQVVVQQQPRPPRSAWQEFWSGI